MTRKKRGTNKPPGAESLGASVASPSAASAPSSPEKSKTNENADQITRAKFQELKATIDRLAKVVLSPAQKQPPTPPQPVKQQPPPPKGPVVNEAGEIDKPPRAEVMDQRSLKKEEARLRKEAAKAAKKQTDGPQKAQQQKQGQNQKQPQKQQINKKQASAQNQNQNNPKKSKIDNKTTEEVDDGKSEPRSALRHPNGLDKSNHRVRFDLQPANHSDKVLGHLPLRRHDFILANDFNVHRAFRQLLAKCEANKFQGVHDLLIEFHRTLIVFVEDYNGDSDLSYREAIAQAIQPQLSVLSDNGSHPFPLAMGNLIRLFRKAIHALPPTTTVLQGREILIQWLHSSLNVNFILAERAISQYTIEKLRNQSQRSILTYGRCPVVEKIILNADEIENLHVCVVDSPDPDSPGKVLLEALNEHNVSCTYGQVSAIGYLIEQCNIVLLGCSAILSNGRVVARKGSSLLALHAQARNIPVLVAAKTCSFVDKVRLDEHLSTALLREPLETIPEDLVTALVTDIRILPPSSAPAVLKAKQLANED